jgi:hypothetical protein
VLSTLTRAPNILILSVSMASNDLSVCRSDGSAGISHKYLRSIFWRSPSASAN